MKCNSHFFKCDVVTEHLHGPAIVRVWVEKQTVDHIAEVVGNSDPRRLVRTPSVRAREGQVAIGVLMQRKARKAIDILGNSGILHIPPRNGANHDIEALVIESVAEHFVLFIHSPDHSLPACKLSG